VHARRLKTKELARAVYGRRQRTLVVNLDNLAYKNNIDIAFFI
jgi:hypothetical protein